MLNPVKTFEEFIKENLDDKTELTQVDSEDNESNDPQIEEYLNKYMDAMERLDSKEIE